MFWLYIGFLEVRRIEVSDGICHSIQSFVLNQQTSCGEKPPCRRLHPPHRDKLHVVIPSRWCPPSYKWVINPYENYRYITNKTIVIGVVNQLSQLRGTTLFVLFVANDIREEEQPIQVELPRNQPNTGQVPIYQALISWFNTHKSHGLIIKSQFR